MPPHPLTNFEINQYCASEPRFNGVYSRSNMPKTIKKGAYVVDLDEYADVGTHWIALYPKELHSKHNEVFYFHSFGMEHVPIEIEKFIKNKDIIANIFRLQAYDSIMCGYFRIKFIGFMVKVLLLNGKSFVDFTNLFSRHDCKKNDKIIIELFK